MLARHFFFLRQAMLCQCGIVSTQHRIKASPWQLETNSTRRRVRTTPRQDDVVSIRCRVYTVSCDTMLCFCKKQHRVNTTPCQHDAMPTRLLAKNGTVSMRCRANRTPWEDIAMSRRHRLETASCQHDAVLTRCRNQNCVTSRQRRVKAASF